MAKTGVTLEGEKNAILALVTAGEDEHWQIGVHYNRIVEQQLAQHAGFTTAAEFFAKELHEVPQATLTLYGAVAKAFTEPQAKRHGVSKLGLLLTYERASRGKPPKDPASAKVRVPKGKSFETKPFADCSANDLRAAIRARGTKNPKQGTLPAADRKRVEALRKALFRALGDHAHAALRADVRGRETVLQLDGVPLALFHAAVAAMSKV